MRQPVFLSVALIFGTLLSSCSLDPEAVEIWGGDVSVPTLLGLTAVSESQLVARFSAPVTVLEASVTVPHDGAVYSAQWSAGSDGKSVTFTVSGTPGIGGRALLCGSVSDSKGDSLSFSVPYTGFNNRLPVLKINEIRTSYSKPKVEFLELYVLRAGNLGGIEICNVQNEDDPSYEFPAAEVAAGEYIVYHLRSMEEGLVDETDSLSVSAGTEARSDARDFWNNLTRSPLKGDNVILLRERKGGAIMDAALLASPDLTAWPSDALKAAAEEAFACGAWLPGPLVTDAANSSGMTTTRTLGRNELSRDTNTAADWKTCATRKASPGSVNVPH